MRPDFPESDAAGRTGEAAFDDTLEIQARLVFVDYFVLEGADPLDNQFAVGGLRLTHSTGHAFG